jgi:hypothetical protein
MEDMSLGFARAGEPVCGEIREDNIGKNLGVIWK